MIPICGAVEEFDPDGYLYINPDVLAHGHDSADADWAAWHFENHGKNENRIQLRSKLLPALMESRRRKWRSFSEHRPALRPNSHH